MVIHSLFLLLFLPAWLFLDGEAITAMWKVVRLREPTVGGHLRKICYGSLEQRKFPYEIKIIAFYTCWICSQGYWTINLHCFSLLILNFSKELSPVVTVNSFYFVADNKHLFVHLTNGSWAVKPCWCTWPWNLLSKSGFLISE